jgi:hypothetical protein
MKNPTRWVWASDPEAPVFTVSEHAAPFGSYYKIKMLLPDGEIYSVKGQKTDKETWFAVAADLYARWNSAAGFDLSRRPERWEKLAASQGDSEEGEGKTAAGPKKFIGEVGKFLIACQIEGIDPSIFDRGFGQSMAAFEQVKAWKAGAKSEWISTKPRKGQKPTAELKKWLASVKPREFWARWDLSVSDDSREIFYK